MTPIKELTDQQKIRARCPNDQDTQIDLEPTPTARVPMRLRGPAVSKPARDNDERG